jgi:AcrR family transcriptional regulator
LPEPAADTSLFRKPEKVESIIHAAYRAIAGKGYSRISMREIALEAGVNKSILHYYFKDKGELISAVFHSLHQQFLDIVQRAVSLPLTIEDRLAEGFREFLEMTEKEPEWFIVIMDLTIQAIQDPEKRHEVYDHSERLREVVADGFRKAKEQGEIGEDVDETALASLVIAVVNGLALQFMVDRGAVDFARAYSDFQSMLQAFLKRGASSEGVE